MSTLLICLVGASGMQAWGDCSRFETRRTHREPTKSGVVGLLANALGRKRSEDISDLRKLKFGVRIDREGRMEMDYQTAKGKKDSYVTKRYYLAGATFLAGIESDDEELLKTLDYALRNPMHPLYLGRRAFFPGLKMSLGIRKADLDTALTEEPWMAPDFFQEWQGKGLKSILLRMVTDADGKDVTYIADDVPVSFNPRNRQYGFRPVHETFITKNIMPGVITRNDPIHGLPAADGHTSVFMTRIQLDLDKQATVEALKNPNRIHGAIESAFPLDGERKLWRIDCLNEEYFLLIVSRCMPQTDSIIEQFGMETKEEPWDVRDYGSFIDSLKEGETRHFRLTANPTNGKKHIPCITWAEQMEWLSDQGKRHGFFIENDTEVTFMVKQDFIKHRHKEDDLNVSFISTTYEGTLKITDEALFKETLTKGLGREKAYGNGMLTLPS